MFSIISNRVFGTEGAWVCQGEGRKEGRKEADHVLIFCDTGADKTYLLLLFEVYGFRSQGGFLIYCILQVGKSILQCVGLPAPHVTERMISLRVG